ncbi:hypothetical protein BOTBODRAFT_31032 [Botryobasidium botryosum FD-172 SS1]|uniref:Nucleolar protein 16 n=1 Tax=Botryobasidium botryosum (strain FD-172 SS1) TaxID=930990 RepID=A0A067MWX1_BOTB1|nr:hypothetical protein BOTBODRAFT_31032 [Botryobasidium botryosum FD-172 SS1]
MANPRQRRKARSSTYKAVSQSRRASKNLKKQPPIKGPKAIQDAWDRKKTLKQNYAALGLMGSMHTRSSGGSEPVIGVEAEMIEPEAIPMATQVPGIPKGKGRIIRDADGNIVDIELGEPHEDEKGGSLVDDEASSSQPWGKPMEDWGAEAAPVAPKTEVVRELERLSTNVVKVPRVASMHEVAWLRSLVALHGTDIEAMARDRKNNVWQKTPGELRKAITKAGGFEKLRV